MMQELFRIPGLNIPIVSFGLMMVIGFLVGMQVGKFLARRSGIDPEIFVNACLLGLVTGVIGARLSHVIENIGQYTDPHRSAWANFIDAVNIRSGGLTYYGGFLLAFPTLVIYAAKKKIPLRLGVDIISPCLMVGLAFGRVGCFLNGCCYRAEGDVPWAVHFPYASYAYEDEFRKGEVNPPAALQVQTPDGGRMLLPKKQVDQSTNLKNLAAAQKSRPLHPSQLYTTVTAFLLAAMLVAYYSTPHA